MSTRLFIRLATFTLTASLALSIPVAGQWVQSTYGVMDGRFSSIALQNGTVLAGSYDGGVFRSTDQGLHWQQSNDGLTERRIISLTTTANKIFAGTITGVFISSNGGESWQASGLQDYQVNSIAVSGNVVLAGHYGIHRSTDGGLTWQPILSGDTSGSVFEIVNSGTNLLARSSNGDVFRSIDQGINWSKINPSGLHVYSIAAKGDLLFVASNLGIYRSLDGGDMWYPFFAFFNGANKVLFFNNTLIAAGYQKIFVLEDLDQAIWSESYVNRESYSDYSQFATDGSILFASALIGGIIFSSDEGHNWETRNNGLVNGIVTSLIAINSTVLAGGHSGIFRSSNNGASWTSNFIIPAPFDYITEFTTIGNLVYAGVGNSGVYRSSDEGVTWTSVSNGLASLFVLCLTSVDNILYAGTNNGIYQSGDGGGSWVPAGLQNNIIKKIYGRENLLFAAIQGYGFYRSTDQAVTWSSISSRIPIAYVNSMVEFNNLIYAGTDGGLFSTIDGDTWSMVSGELLDKSVAYVSSNEDQLFISLSYQGVLYSYTGNSIQLISSTEFAGKNINCMATMGESLLASLSNYNYGSIWSTSLTSIPGITSFEPQQGKVGTLVTINGKGFSPIKEENQVQFNGLPAPILSASNNSLTVQVPGTTGSTPLKVIVNNNIITTINSFTIEPDLKSFSPSSGIVNTMVTILGSSLHVEDVFFNGVRALTYYLSNTKIIAAVPAGATSGPITLVVNGKPITSLTPFNVIPKIDRFYPTSGIVGAEISIYGSGFDPVLANNEVRFNNTLAQKIRGNENHIVVTVPMGTASGGITVEVSGIKTQSFEQFLILPLPSNCFTLPVRPYISELPGPVLISSSASGNQWYFNGVKLFGESKETISVSQSGTYTVQVTQDGCKSEFSEPYPLVITGEIISSNELALYPNPTSQWIYIRTPDYMRDQRTTFQIYNSLGQSVMSSTCYSNDHEQLDLSGITNGHYVLELRSNMNVKIIRFIKE